MAQEDPTGYPEDLRHPNTRLLHGGTLAGHCTTPGGTIHVGYRVKGAPESVRCGVPSVMTCWSHIEKEKKVGYKIIHKI